MSKAIALVGACTLLVVTVVARTGAAGQPATQTLDPPPPSFLACKAVGGGTICSGTRSFAYSDLVNDEGGGPRSRAEAARTRSCSSTAVSTTRTSSAPTT